MSDDNRNQGGAALPPAAQAPQAPAPQVSAASEVDEEFMSGMRDAWKASQEGGGAGGDTLNGGAADPNKKKDDLEVGDTDPNKGADPNKGVQDDPEAKKKAEDEAKAKAEADAKKAAEDEANRQPDEFDKFQLPKHARGETGKQFTDLKALSRKLVSEAKAEADKLRVELEGLKKNPVKSFEMPEDLKRELTELREIERMVNVEHSRAFKEKYDVPVAKHTDKVWESLKEAGYSDADVETAKKLGVDGIDWKKALPEGMPEAQRNRIRRALDKLEAVKDERKEALTAARSESSEFAKRLAEAPDQEIVRAKTGYEGAMTILNEKKFFTPWDLTKLPADLPKNVAEALNEGIEEAKKFIDIYKDDASPKAHAELLAIAAGGQKYVAVNKRLNADLKATQQQLAEAVAKVTKAEAELVKIRTAGAAPSKPAAPAGNRPDTTPFGEGGSLRERFGQFVSGGQ